MSKNIKLNNTDYNGVSTVQLPTTNGGTATFKDTDEIMTPSGTKTITENGTHDVTNYANAIVNIASSGGSSENSYEMGTFEITEICTNYTYTHELGRVPKFAIVYPISVAQAQIEYQIMTELIINELGQENYAGKEGDTFPNNPYVNFSGLGYSKTVVGQGTRYGSMVGTIYDVIKVSETSVVVGSYNTQAASNGKLAVGTYGIIVG